MLFRQLKQEEIETLQAHQCTAKSWTDIEVINDFEPDFLFRVQFSGKCRLGHFQKEIMLPGGLEVHSGISDATIHNCTIGNNARIHNVHNYIANYDIGDDCYIENIDALIVDGETNFGNGLRIAVMNEGGGREIPIYDCLSAHLAYILTLYRHRPTMLEKVYKMIEQYSESHRSQRGKIGNNVQIINTGSIINVRIGDYANINGASVLKNGTFNSTKNAPIIIGSGVNCNNFIACSGVEILDNTLISNCFIGQGCQFGKHYSASDSLFFSNCQGMHGEAASIFAGPFTVSHHKSTLLIAGMFSFLNAGSGSNQSNHMYKLGPIHQGVAERGAKTTSDSYMLWPAKVGAFTLIMGRHTKHFDTSDFPFSYLIENATQSYLVPGVNLRSIGTIRDAQKWPKRDNRHDTNKIDHINYNILSPYTIQKMIRGQEKLKEIQSLCGQTTEEYTYQNFIIKNHSLRSGLNFYRIGIRKFLGNSLISRLQKGEWKNLDEIKNVLKPNSSIGQGEWIDLAGLIVPRSQIQEMLNKIEHDEITTLDQIENIFKQLSDMYYEYEWTWASQVLEKLWGKTLENVTFDDLIKTVLSWKEAVVDLDHMIYEDAKKEFNLNSQTGFGIDGDLKQKLLDFEQVRGSFESNTFVMAILEHIENKSALAETMLKQLKDVMNQQ